MHARFAIALVVVALFVSGAVLFVWSCSRPLHDPTCDVPPWPVSETPPD